jgi:hypothetical protein
MFISGNIIEILAGIPVPYSQAVWRRQHISIKNDGEAEAWLLFCLTSPQYKEKWSLLTPDA